MPLATTEEIQTLAAAWRTSFPGDAHTLQTLRAHLITADLQLRRDHIALQGFEDVLTGTGIPAFLWPSYHQQNLDRLRRRHSRSQIDFNRALAALQAAYTTSLPKPSKPTEPEPPSVPTVAPESSQSELFQTVRISVENGLTITETAQPASFWLEKNAWDYCIAFTRQFQFQDAVVPTEYAYVLLHDGQTQAAAEHLNIAYSPAEFQNLCRLEIESGSPHLLDGPRLDYRQYD